MIEKANLLACAASIGMGSGGLVNFQDGCAITRLSAGTYQVAVDSQQQLPLSVGIPDAKVIVGPGVPASVAVTAPSVNSAGQTVFIVTTSTTSGGSAADITGTLTFLCWGLGNPGAGAV